MALETLDRSGRKAGKESGAEIDIIQVDEYLNLITPPLLEIDEYPASGATVVADMKKMGILQYYTWNELSTAVPLDIIWTQIEQPMTGAVNISEGKLVNSWEQYLNENWDELVAKYKGKYVVIWKGTVYDSDKDLATLAKRVYAALGYRAIFMPYIGTRGRVAEFSLLM